MEDEDKEVSGYSKLNKYNIIDVKFPNNDWCVLFVYNQKKPDWSKKGGEGEKKVKDGDEGDSGAEDVKA